MMRPRKEFSKRLLDKQPMNDSARQLLAFFETVGVVVNRAGIDPYIVWSEFCWHAKHYYAALADAIKETRQQTKDPTLYNQFEWVNDELLKIDAKERAITLDDAKPNIHDLETFFKGECELMVELMVPVNEKKAKDPNQQLQPDEKSGHV